MEAENGRPPVNSDQFWDANQPGFRFTHETPGTPEFFRAVEQHRYRLEPHIREVVSFESWVGKDVLEAGCGIATDGVQFARAGARYVGVDRSEDALALARRRFELEGLSGEFFKSSVTSLPFDDRSFDLVYSHGVIHHIEDTWAAVREFARVLKRGGTALVMLYHRSSLNYYVNILTIRRLLAAGLLLPGAAQAAARLTGERSEVLRGHEQLLKAHGLRYLADRRLFLNNNTDGPGNPLSKVYTRAEAAALFHPYFQTVKTDVRYLNLRLYPRGEEFAATRLARKLERRVGWHLYIRAS